MIAVAIPLDGASFSSCTRLYVFGDSYSDIGEGYLDGNGPTAVAYFAEHLGLKLMRSNDETAAGQSLDFAISGAGTGTGKGTRIEGALLGVGMHNQVEDFAARVHSRAIDFDPAQTVFFLAGGLNDGKLPRGVAAENLKDEIKTLYSLGGRRFVVALLPVAIPGFSVVGERLNPDLSSIPNSLRGELPGSQIVLSRWGFFFDKVMRHPARYGISNTTTPCAGRSIFHEDPTPCLHPDRYFYYHEGHPSTSVQKVVGEMLYREYLQWSAQRPSPSMTHIPVVPAKSGVAGTMIRVDSPM